MRNLLIALGVLALLGVLTFVTFRKSPDEPATAVTDPWHRLERAQVTKITLQRPDHTPPITLEKRGESWFMSSPATGPADGAAVNDILEPLAEMHVTSTAAREPASHATLEVDDAHATRVTLFHDAATVLDLLVGRTLDNGTAVRLPNQPVVYRVDRSVRYAIGKEPREYRDRSVTQIARDHVRSVEWHNAQGTFGFDRNGDTWTAAASNPPVARLDTAKVNTLVSNLLTLRATDFTAPGEPNGIDANGPHVTINMDNGPSVTLRVGSTVAPSGVNLRRDGNDLVYQVAQSHAHEIDLDSSLLQAPLPPEGGTGDATAAAPPPSAMPMQMGGPGGPGGAGGQQIPPEILQQLRQQMMQRGAGGAAGGAPPPH